MAWPETTVETIAEFIKITLKMFLLNSVIRAKYESFCVGYENIDPLQNVIPRSAVLGVDNLLVMGQSDVFDNAVGWKPIGANR